MCFLGRKSDRVLPDRELVAAHQVAIIGSVRKNRSVRQRGQKPFKPNQWCAGGSRVARVLHSVGAPQVSCPRWTPGAWCERTHDSPLALRCPTGDYNQSMPYDFGAAASVIGRQIVARLAGSETELRQRWLSAFPVRHFFIDDLLPADSVLRAYRNIPPRSSLMRKKSLREKKWVGVEIDRYNPAIGEHLLAFQQPEVIEVIARITGLRYMEADPSLYASGISVMERGDFLNPHIDNSHDGDQRLYRVLNLLYYVSPDWSIDRGGNLELWTAALDRPTIIESRCNRLVVMSTDDTSWHSVQRVVSDEARICFSNYYFSSMAPGNHEYRNVTSFRGRPEEFFKRIVLRADAAALNAIGSALPFLLRHNRHRR